MAKQKQTKTDSIIQPSVKVEGEKHVLEKLFEGETEKMPTLKSIGYTKLENTNTWISYVITTQGREVLKVEVDEPNLRAIAEETSKINFVSCFIDKALA